MMEVMIPDKGLSRLVLQAALLLCHPNLHIHTHVKALYALQKGANRGEIEHDMCLSYFELEEDQQCCRMYLYCLVTWFSGVLLQLCNWQVKLISQCALYKAQWS